MKCIDKLSKSYLSSSTLRRRLVLLAVILSTVLMISVGGLSLTNPTSTKIRYKEWLAGFDASYSDINDRQITLVKKNKSITDYTIKHSLLPGIFYGEKTKIKLSHVDENYRNQFGYEIKEGVYPEKKDEIAFTESALEELGFKGDIGDVIYISENGNEAEMQEFILSGIVSDRFYDSYRSKAFISEAYLQNADKNNVTTTLYISIQKSLDAARSIDQIAEEAGIVPSNVTTMRVELDNVWIGLFLGLLIVMLSIITISNIFSYSIIERVNAIGLLKAVGMTTKQLKKLFKKEGYYYYFRGVPIGIVVGLAIYVSTLTLMYNNMEAGPYSLIGFLWLIVSLGHKFHLGLLIAVLILEAVGLYLAIIIPSRKVKKMSIVDAVHFVDNIKIRKDVKKNSLFKNPALRLAYVNLGNNKLKSVLSILSISICVGVFIYFSIFVSYMDPEISARRGSIGEIDIYGLSYQQMEDIKQIPGINQIYTRIGHKGKLPVEEIKIKETYVEQIERLEKLKSKDKTAEIQIYGYDDAMLDKMSKYIVSEEALEDLKKREDWCLIFDFYKTGDYKIGDYLTIDGHKMKIVGTLKRLQGYYGWQTHIAPAAVVNFNHIENNYNPKDYNGNIAAMNVNEDELESVKSYIKQQFLTDDNVYCSFLDEDIEREKNGKNAMVILGYSFVAIIAVISLFMLVNSIYTSIITRKREFGMLRAIGMTRKQFYQYLRFEGSIIILFITLLGTPLGYLLGWLGYKNFTNIAGNQDFVFTFPYWSLLIIVVYYILIQLIIRVSMKRMDKEAVVELIRQI